MIASQELNRLAEAFIATIKFFVFLAWILFGLCALIYAAFTSEDDFRSAYFINRENKSLAGQAVKKIDSPSLLTCSQACLRHSWCTSTNYKESFGERNKGNCELHKHEFSTINDDTNLTDQPGATFSMFLKGYLMTGCFNGGSFLFDKEKGTFACSCNLPWRGEKCELDVDECSASPVCDINASCSNTHGSYNCTCKSGYTGDGETCQENWKKINTYPVCFGAKDDLYGLFSNKESGVIYTFKLVHRNGSVSCSPGYSSYWGCGHFSYGDEKLLTVITFQNRSVLLLADYRRTQGDDCKYYSYKIKGVGINQPELRFNNLPSPLSVSVRQEFQLWFAHDLTGCVESDNSGQTCADVYAWYA